MKRLKIISLYKFRDECCQHCSIKETPYDVFFEALGSLTAYLFKQWCRESGNRYEYMGGTTYKILF